MLRILSTATAFILLILFLYGAINHFPSGSPGQILSGPTPTPTVTVTPTPTVPAALPQSYSIPGKLHVFQTFNNCGPASLSMLLSYFNVNVTQGELGEKLRPYQNPKGDNDDKSVTLSELAKAAETYGFSVYHRPGGTIEIMKQFIARDIPVLTRTWLETGKDIGHYRLVRGYDEATGEIIQDDSLQNKNLRYSYEDFKKLWEPFSYEYLVIVPKDKEQLVAALLGNEMDTLAAWTKTKSRLELELKNNPDSMYTLFNLSVASYNIGEYGEAIRYFEKVRYRLPMRMLWYQIEPVEAYFKAKEYDKLMQLTDEILRNHNRAFSELYFLRGNVFLERGENEAAKKEFEKAVLYNRNFTPAIEALKSL